VRQLQGLEVERSRSASLDVGRHIDHVALNGTFFGLEVRDPLMLRHLGDGTVELFNAAEPTHTGGTDLLARFHEDAFHVTATYTHTRATELDSERDGRRVVPLTPRHAAGVVGMWEAEEAGRIGVELTSVEQLHGPIPDRYETTRDEPPLPKKGAAHRISTNRPERVTVCAFRCPADRF
jgi:outer membrane receptor for ferrienterochelin and colicins